MNMVPALRPQRQAKSRRALAFAITRVDDDEATAFAFRLVIGLVDRGGFQFALTFLPGGIVLGCSGIDSNKFHANGLAACQSHPLPGQRVNADAIVKHMFERPMRRLVVTGPLCIDRMR